MKNLRGILFLGLALAVFNCVVIVVDSAHHYSFSHSHSSSSSSHPSSQNWDDMETMGDGSNWMSPSKGGRAVELEQEMRTEIEKTITIKYEAEYKITTIDYEFVIEIANEYYCERFGELHVLCALDVSQLSIT
jgi:hypothetical protein